MSGMGHARRADLKLNLAIEEGRHQRSRIVVHRMGGSVGLPKVSAQQTEYSQTEGRPRVSIKMEQHRETGSPNNHHEMYGRRIQGYSFDNTLLLSTRYPLAKPSSKTF